MSNEIVQSPDNETAQDRRSVLYMYGERYAAGTLIECLPSEAEHRLGRFLENLDVAVGGLGRTA